MFAKSQPVPALAGTASALLGAALCQVASLNDDAHSVVWTPRDPATVAAALAPPAAVEVDPKAKGKAAAKPAAAAAKKPAAAAGKGKGAVDTPVLAPPTAPEGLPLQLVAVPKGLSPAAHAVMQQVRMFGA